MWVLSGWCICVCLVGDFCLLIVYESACFFIKQWFLKGKARKLFFILIQFVFKYSTACLIFSERKVSRGWFFLSLNLQYYHPKQHLHRRFPHLSHIPFPPPPPTLAHSTATLRPTCVAGNRTKVTNLTGQGSMERPARSGQDPLVITLRQTMVRTLSFCLFHLFSLSLVLLHL